MYLIIAGAGTGKTRTLVYRVARLVELGYDPRSILLLTFTRKAAREMITRAELLLDQRCAKVSGGTFHSFANLTLRKYAKAINLDPSFTILDQGDAEDVVNLIRSQAGLVSKEKRFPNKRTLYKIYSLSVNTGREIDQIVEQEYPHFLEHIDDMNYVFRAFTDYKRVNYLLDYDDLLVYLRDFLWEFSPAAKSLLNNINFIMVDEYQDTNKLQSEIVQGLAQIRENVMVVGDDSQSIYSFRGANFKNIIEFPKMFDNVTTIMLEENYRSTQHILNFANVINQNALEKFEKNLFSMHKDGPMPGIVATASENLQSKFIVEKVLELLEEGIPLSDMAVLFRSSFFSFDLEIELSKANIPFVKVGGMKFIETAHIKDILAFLRIIQNPRDMVSWFRVLLLHEGVGPKSAEKLLDALSGKHFEIKSDPGYLGKARIVARVKELFELLYLLITQEKSPTDKAQQVIEYYNPIFKLKYDDWNKRRKDIDIFLNITEKYKSLNSLLSDMAIEPPVDSVTDIGDEDKQEDHLTLSTIHSAKGLEWHTVFVMHALEGFFPGTRFSEKIDQIEEERRLMYVAVTRAARNLFISYPMNIYDRESGTTLSKPSRFLSDINSDLAEGYLLE